MRLRAGSPLTRAAEEAGEGRDQEGQPAFKFMHGEAITNREAS
jgi:hypothetical protein